MSRFLKLFTVLALAAASLVTANSAQADYHCAYYYPYTCSSPGDYDSGDGWAGDYGYAPYYYAHDYDDPGPAILAGMLLGGAIGYGAGFGPGVVINNNAGGFSPGFHRGFHRFGRFDHRHFDHHHHFHHAGFHHGPHHGMHPGMHHHPFFHHHR